MSTARVTQTTFLVSAYIQICTRSVWLTSRLGPLMGWDWSVAMLSAVPIVCQDQVLSKALLG